MLASTGLATAQTADRFKGKIFEIVVGYDTGGGYDIYARALARHIGKHLPGSQLPLQHRAEGRHRHWYDRAWVAHGRTFGVRRHPFRERQVQLDREHE